MLLIIFISARNKHWKEQLAENAVWGYEELECKGFTKPFKKKYIYTHTYSRVNYKLPAEMKI